jgi:hypothetical protein
METGKNRGNAMEKPFVLLHLVGDQAPQLVIRSQEYYVSKCGRLVSGQVVLYAPGPTTIKCICWPCLEKYIADQRGLTSLAESVRP